MNTKDKKTTNTHKKKSKFVKTVNGVKIDFRKNGNNFVDTYNILYKEKAYVVCIVKYTQTGKKTKHVPFVVDLEDYDDISNYSWYYVVNGGYMYHIVKAGDTKKPMYLHNFVNKRYSFPGKGGDMTIDHLNQITTDNRKENLKLKTQSEQNCNQKKKIRHTKLPVDCPIDVDDIPENIYYVKQSGNHGEHFSIEIKHNGKKVFRKKTTKSKKYTLEQKLLQAKQILLQTKEDNPEWFSKAMNGLLTKYNEKLRKSYFEILKKAKVKDPFNVIRKPKDILKIPKEDTIDITTKFLPENFKSLPKYVRYAKPRGAKGEMFLYEKRENGKRTCYQSSGSKKVDLQKKYDDFMIRLKKLKVFENKDDKVFSILKGK